MYKDFPYQYWNLEFEILSQGLILSSSELKDREYLLIGFENII